MSTKKNQNSGRPGIFAPHMDEFQQRGGGVGALCGKTAHLHRTNFNPVMSQKHLDLKCERDEYPQIKKQGT